MYNKHLHTTWCKTIKTVFAPNSYGKWLMKTKHAYFILFILLSYSCSHRTTTTNNEKVEIPKHWIELTKENKNWIYLNSCKNERNPQSIKLIKINGKEAILWDSGTEGQWYEIKQMRNTKDSLSISTVLPYDTLVKIVFVFKYIDRIKNIGTWRIFEGNGSSYENTFIPIEDTLNFTRVHQ